MAPSPRRLCLPFPGRNRRGALHGRHLCCKHHAVPALRQEPWVSFVLRLAAQQHLWVARGWHVPWHHSLAPLAKRRLGLCVVLARRSIPVHGLNLVPGWAKSSHCRCIGSCPNMAAWWSRARSFNVLVRDTSPLAEWAHLLPPVGPGRHSPRCCPRREATVCPHVGHADLGGFAAREPQRRCFEPQPIFGLVQQRNAPWRSGRATL
mmetsp:Transcript_7876/g.18555  ORF Transcript_7876/g.18555 Transcript_7876/m.18555 type:complete len:206 (+) Transcript_7876:275-892(+)